MVAPTTAKKITAVTIFKLPIGNINENTASFLSIDRNTIALP